MPQRAGSTCKRQGCAGVVRDGVCSVCGPLRVAGQRALDERRGTAAQRGYGGRWQRYRAMYLRSHPLCVACERAGITTPATDVDHIVPRRAGGSDEESNLQALCHACHSAKTGRGE
jgi:5-methylcytosine-specific restriction enzyme A